MFLRRKSNAYCKPQIKQSKCKTTLTPPCINYKAKNSLILVNYDKERGAAAGISILDNNQERSVGKGNK